MTLLEISKAKGKRLLKSCWPLVHFYFEVLINSYTQQSWTWKWDPLKDNYISFLRIKNSLLKWKSSIPLFKTHKIIGNLKKNDWKKSALFLNEWWSGVHSHFKNGSERVSALIFFLVSEIWAKLKILVSVEHVAYLE